MFIATRPIYYSRSVRSDMCSPNDMALLRSAKSDNTEAINMLLLRSKYQAYAPEQNTEHVAPHPETTQNLSERQLRPPSIF